MAIIFQIEPHICQTRRSSSANDAILKTIFIIISSYISFSLILSPVSISKRCVFSSRTSSLITSPLLYLFSSSVISIISTSPTRIPILRSSPRFSNVAISSEVPLESSPPISTSIGRTPILQQNHHEPHCSISLELQSSD